MAKMENSQTTGITLVESTYVVLRDLIVNGQLAAGSRVIETDLAGDLFLILGETDEARGRAVIRAVVNPLVVWIWLGGVLLVLGTLVSFIRPGAFLTVLEMKRETRSRYAGAVVVIGTVLVAALAAGQLSGMPAAIAVVGALALLAAIHQFAGALSGLMRDGGGR